MSINTQTQSDIMDLLVICTGTSNTHVKSLASKLITSCKKAKLSIIGYEGMDTSEWVLIDLGDVVVHIMQKDIRDYYQLERLWEPFAEEAFKESKN